MRRFYVVFVGRNPGIYDTWTDCYLQTNGYSGSLFKSFTSYEEAEVAHDRYFNHMAKTHYHSGSLAAYGYGNEPKHNPRDTVYAVAGLAAASVVVVFAWFFF